MLLAGVAGNFLPRFRIGHGLVIAAGQKFTQIATNSMGELLMATPALSDGVMYVRSSTSLFAIGRKP